MKKNLQRKELKAFDPNDYAQLPNSGLLAYLEHVKKGSQDVYRTTFFKGREPARILGDWDALLVKGLKGKFPELLAFEEDLRSKVGPLSVMKPLDDRMADIDHYYEDILNPQIPIRKSALLSVLAEWDLDDGVELNSPIETIRKMKKSTNSGLPYFAKRRKVLEFSAGAVPWHYETWGVSEWGYLKKGESIETPYKTCAVLGWRGQEGGPDDDDVKQRVVWMFPMVVNVQELRAYQPLIEHFQAHNYVPAWVSMDKVDEEITALFDTKGKDDYVICTDFSKFDQHFGPVMQDAARFLMQSYLKDSGNSDFWMDEIFPIKYGIPLMLQLDEIRTGKHGMGSGSGGTNADETLAHRALQHEAAILAHSRLNPHSQCLGDDGILSYPGIQVDDVIRSYTAHGLEMNATKQYVSKHDCVYLRRWHGDKYRLNGICVGVYSTHRALGRLMYQERFYDSDLWSNRMVALRQLSILENCKYHPLFREFVSYCMKGDKYRLGIDIPGFLDDIDSIANEATELMPDFLGYTKTMQKKDYSVGIGEWEVVKLLKSWNKSKR